MLRAVRFAASYRTRDREKTLAPHSSAGVAAAECAPPARLFDEMLSCCSPGMQPSASRVWRREGLHHGLLPMLGRDPGQPLGERFVMLP